MLAFSHRFRLAKRDHIVRSRIRSATVCLPIQTLVLKKHHRIVTANRRAQQAVRIERIRRKHDAHARRVGKQHLARLRMVKRAAR